jgi:hypothetical protein
MLVCFDIFIVPCYYKAWILNNSGKLKLSRYRNAGAEGERKYRPDSFLTSALDAGEWSASRPGRA